MSFVALFISATKLAGILVTVTVAANAVSFHRYRRKNLRPFRSPIDESADVLADFTSLSGSEEEGFFFGLATAPAHVEDRLDDAWLQFAEEHPCADSENMKNSQQADALMASASADGGSQQASLAKDEPKSAGVKVAKMPLKISMEAMIRGFEKYLEEEEDKECSHTVAAWHNVPHPQERLRFWSEPDIELKLAKDTGITVFRMGLDWMRIMPKEPKDGLSDTVRVSYATLYPFSLNYDYQNFYQSWTKYSSDWMLMAEILNFSIKDLLSYCGYHCVEKMLFGEEIKNIIACERTERKERHEKLERSVQRLEMVALAMSRSATTACCKPGE